MMMTYITQRQESKPSWLFFKVLKCSPLETCKGILLLHSSQSLLGVEDAGQVAVLSRRRRALCAKFGELPRRVRAWVKMILLTARPLKPECCFKV